MKIINFNNVNTKEYLKIFWLPLILILLICTNVFFARYLRINIEKMKWISNNYKRELLKDEKVLKILKEGVEEKKKSLFNIYRFKTDLEAYTFLLTRIFPKIKSFGLKLREYEFITSEKEENSPVLRIPKENFQVGEQRKSILVSSSEEEFKYIPVLLKMDSDEYDSIVKLIDFFENEVYLLVYKVNIQKIGLTLDVEIGFELPYKQIRQ